MNRPDPLRPQDTLFTSQMGSSTPKIGCGCWMPAAAGVPVPGAAKLICMDIATRKVVATLPLGAVVEPTSYLNDLRIDTRRKAMFISDQGQDGKGAILAVDLATGRTARRLAQHSSTASVKHVLKTVEGQTLMKRGANGTTAEIQGGANGLALSPDGKRVYYSPLMGRHL